MADRIYFEKLKPRLAGLFFGARSTMLRVKQLRPWRYVLLGLALGAACCVANAAPPSWPNTFTARLEALALLQTLNADLLSHDSATATLQRWCESHQLAPDPHISAIQVRVAPKAPSDEQRQALHVAAGGSGSLPTREIVVWRAAAVRSR